VVRIALVDLDEYRKTSHATWERMSTGWDSWRQFLWDATRNIREWLIRELDPQAGQTILDIAAGAGDTGFAAAATLGPDGHLITTDFSPKMVDVARRRRKELGIDNVEFRVLDAENMDLDDDSVDGVVCRWGYMLMADPTAALAETRRVLRPGGRLAFAVWAEPAKNPFASVPAGILIERGHIPPPEPGAPGIFAMADHGRIKELVTGAGFADPRIEEVPIDFTYDGADQYWRTTNELAGPVAAAIAKLPEEEQQSIRAEVEKRIEQYKSNGGYALPTTPIGVSTQAS
jgi:ubiquinone/menaquinone biosynthesis C-methylase UbiE